RAGRQERPDPDQAGAAGAGGAHGPRGRGRPYPGQRGDEARTGARAGRGHGQRAERRRPQRAAGAPSARLQPRPAGGRRALRPAAAVRHRQAAYGLAVDGIAGPKTHRLVGLLKRQANTRAPVGGEKAPPSNQSPPSTKPAQPAPSTTPQPVTPVTPIAQKGNDDATLIATIALAPPATPAPAPS